MNKRNKAIVIAVLALLLILTVTVFTACKEATQKFKINFVVDNAVYDSIETNGNETLVLPSQPQKADYTFIGWYYDVNVWNQPFSITDFSDKVLEENIYVYARFEKSTTQQMFKITFVANDLVINTVNSSGSEVISLPQAPVIEGYTFEGWYLDKDTWVQPFDGTEYQNTPLDKDIYVYAKYQLKKYTIFFIADNKTVDTIQTSGNQVLTLPDAPYKPNYNFMGWYFDKNTWKKALTVSSYKDTTLTQNISVYAYYKYSPEVSTKYAVNFWANNKNIKTIMSSGYEYIALPDAPYVDGYEFIGWYLDNNVWQIEFDGNNYLNSAITSVVNVYAYYVKTEVKYTVSFETNGGTSIDDMFVSVINSIPVPTKVGPYEFGGWYFDSNFTQPVSFPYYPESNVTLYAKWIEVESTFTLNDRNFISGVSAIPEDGILTIPSYVNGVKVEGIASYAFQFNEELKRVTVSDGIRYIYPNAFQYCTNLQTVVLGYGTMSINSFAFQGCSSLKTISLPSSLISIDQGAFIGIGATQVIIPYSVTFIGQYAFQDCSNLVNIDLGRVKVLGKGVFKNCTSLQSITLPYTITELQEGGSNLFSGCKNLSNITMPENDIDVSYSMFNDTAYYDNQSNWQDGVLYIGRYLIGVNDKFTATTYSVRNGTTVIADNAFTYYMSNNTLTTVYLPDGLKIIGKQAFYRYNALKSCNIPDSVEKIGKDAFLYTLLVKEGQTNYVGNWLINYVVSTGETTLAIREGTVGIAEGQITGSTNNNITTIILPDSLKYIGTENFKDFQAVTTVKSSSSLKRIEDNAFQNCYALKEFDLSTCTNLQYIGNTVFSWCKVYDNIYIPQSVVYMGSDVFNQVTGTISIEINQTEVPDTWDSSWNFTYGPDLKILWGVSNPSK